MITTIPQESEDFPIIIMEDGIITILITPICISTMVLHIITVLV